MEYTVNFEKETKRSAVKAFSRVYGSIGAYLVFTTVLALVVQIVTGFIVGAEGLLALAENPYYVWGMQIGVMYVVCFPLFLLMVRKLPSAQRTKGDMSLKEFGYIFLVSEAIMLIGALFSNWLTSIFSGMLGHEIPNTTADLISSTPIWIIIVVVVVIGPIVEEMIFRKVMIDKLSVYGDRMAVILSAFAFGLFHGNFYQLFYATALGLVLGYVYTKTRRSVYNCLLHMAVNFMGTVPTLISQPVIDKLNALPEDAVIDGALLGEYYLVTGLSLLQYVLAIAGVIVFVKATKRRAYSLSRECDIILPKSSYPRVLLFNAGVIFFLIVTIAQCVSSLFLV